MTSLPDISEHLPIKEGFCRPDWEAIGAIIESNPGTEAKSAAWKQATRTWIECLKESLAGAYQIHETANFLILSQDPEDLAQDLCRFSEYALGRILTYLDGVASDEGYGYQVVLMFGSLDDYYRYIMYFFPAGDQPMNGGVCLGGDGYIHLAFPATNPSLYRTMLVHELTHACLADLPLPAWLNEAMAMRMELVIAGFDHFHLDKELYQRHLAHWNAETIQQFWSGQAWGIHGESFELSYNLAQVLWRKMEVDVGAPHDVLLEMLGAASKDDAGQEACQSLLGLSLGELVDDFLGPGHWEPRPENWAENG